MWSPNGRELLYLPASETDNRILAVDVSPGPPLRFTNPHVAFGLPISAGSMHPFALDRDGRRLVMVRSDRRLPTELLSLTLIRNWAEEVKAEVAAGK